MSGVNLHYPETVRPALEVIGAHPKAGLVSGVADLLGTPAATLAEQLPLTAEVSAALVDLLLTE